MDFKQTLSEREFDLPDFEQIARDYRIPAFRNHFAYAGIASIPRREVNLRLVIDSLYNQFEHFFVYLNEYPHMPDWLDDPKITVFRSQDYRDLSATGKIFFAQFVDRGYFFTLDDDFIYPGNYAARMVDAIDRHAGRVAACVHGSIFPPQPKYYYLRVSIYQYPGALPGDRFVCLPGTASFAVKAGTIDLSLDTFLPQVMVDLTCAIICKNSGLPIVSVGRQAGWMQNTDREGLYHQFSKEITYHTEYANLYAPWGFDQYAEEIGQIHDIILATKGVDPATDERYDNDAFLAVRKGITPANWAYTPHYYAKLSNLLRVQQEGVPK
ncbi:MAG: hypothetical protein GDA52_07550 [Rhodobacteraceae bacterium]|nr:hypothetical protein [Paracoccaceae bacterium]